MGKGWSSFEMYKINKKGIDWCHICGKKEGETIDIWYPFNAEHDKENTEYIRICVFCIEEMLQVGKGV